MNWRLRLLLLSDDTLSISSIGSSSSATSLTTSSRSVLDQLVSNTRFIKCNSSISTTSSCASLTNSNASNHPLVNTSTSTQEKLQSIENISTCKDDLIDAIKERLFTKIDPVEMTSKPPTIVIVPQDSIKRSAMLLSGTKFRLNRKVIALDHSTLNNNHIYSVSVSTRRKLSH